MKKVFGFIGAGNMGGAVLRAACKGVGAENVFVFDMNVAKATELARETGCTAVQAAAELASAADFVFLCVKPNQVADVLRGVFAQLEGKTVVSIAAGVSIADIAAVLAEGGLRLPIIRLLPNTPMLVGKGMTVMAACPGASAEDKEAVRSAISAGGEVLELEEKLIDAATPVFSSSPAFVYMFIEALSDGGVMAGLPRDMAMKLGAQAVLGAAAMVLETGKHPGALKDEVCSPGGSTIVGVEELERGGMRAAVASAVMEAYKKTTQLGK